MDRHSLELLEYDRVVAAIAERATCDGARAALLASRPMADRAARRAEIGRLAEAIRRVAEPGEWCAVGPRTLSDPLERSAREPLDGLALVDVRCWLEAAESVRASWAGDDARARHPALASLAEGAAPPAELRERLTRSLEDDGTLRDGASPELRRARDELRGGERKLEHDLERWIRGFGAESYVTRHGDRFVAMVPAAGFPRRRGIVHDVSGSGHSLLVEPLEACESNNRLIELRAIAAEEERRLLRELSQAVLAAREDLMRLEATLVALDALRARARWALEHGGVALEPGGDRLRLVRSRHPLLAMAERRGEGASPVPLDLELGDRGRFLLVSGPNMGGKTVLLKTVGLAVSQAHAALPVLASEGSAVPEIDVLLVDLGDEQSVEQGLSTFAAHLQVLARMAESAGPRTLVLCDELGAGTDPEEGGALGQAMIERFAATGTWGVATTHLGSLKRLGAETAGVASGSLEFDVETFTSRYRFLPGVPGASHALAVAERLGFPAEVLERARNLTPEEAKAVERLAAALAAAHAAALAERSELERARRAAEGEAAGHREAVERVQREWAERRRALRREGEDLLSRARGLWQTLEREARRREMKREELRPVLDELRSAEGELDAMSGPEPEAGSGVPIPADALVPGARVRVADLGVEAEVVAAPDAEGRVQLRRGHWTIQSHVSKLRPVAPAGPPQVPGRPEHGARATWTLAESAPALEVDLRGMDVDEALTELDRGLDRAVVSGLGEIRVVHGIGRGILRAAVERHLRGHPHVTDQRLGQVGEGGRGVTVVKLR